MKETKIQAWDTEMNYMTDKYCGKSGDGKSDWVIFFPDINHPQVSFGGIDNPYSRERFKLRESIGIKDKDGNELFNGDIFHASCKEWRWENEMSKIIYENGKFQGLTYVINAEDRVLWNVYFDFDEDLIIEKLGNVYENAELLNILPDRRASLGRTYPA